ncbi:MAG: sulfatase-like hydrolase/transferase [Acidimicrobiales bacterium]
MDFSRRTLSARDRSQCHRRTGRDHTLVGLHAHTPNLDALAASGRTFERAYCSVPICFASRASIMWGREPSTLDMVDDSPAAHQKFLSLTLDASAPHLASTMAAHGYHTLSARQDLPRLAKRALAHPGHVPVPVPAQQPVSERS